MKYFRYLFYYAACVQIKMIFHDKQIIAKSSIFIIRGTKIKSHYM